VSDTNNINKENMLNFLEFLSEDRIMVGPVDTGKVVEYREASFSEITIDDRVSYNSIKAYYFPQTELMFTFENDEVVDNTDIPGYLIFGAKPCDLEALKVMSTVYSTGKYADPFFQRRFDANFLIGIGCINQKPGCFCQEMGIDKGYSDYCDIMLKDNGDSYSIEHLSEKGKQALISYAQKKNQDEFSDFLNRNTTEQSTCLRNTPEPPSCLEPPPRLKLDVKKDDSDYFDIIDWAKVTETCKGCGICTYICPTCYCFDFKDVSKKDIAKRYKCWDSCMYPKFTLHASGHNPREHRFERYRQRVLHKYKYVPENFEDRVACTGCGRCVRSCPVGINIKEIVKEILVKEK